MIGTLLGIGAGLVGGIGKMLGRKKANKQLDALLAKDPQYAENPEAAKRLGLANTLLNARMPGAMAAEKNIYTNHANTTSNVLRNSTDSSQALAIAAGVGGQTNQAFEDLQQNELQDYQRRYGNMEDARDSYIQEGDKVFNDKIRRYGNEVQIRGTQNQNKQDNWQDISNMGFGMADFSMNGGFKNIFNKRSQGTSQLQPLQYNGTWGSNVPMTGGMQNRRTPNFG